MSEISDSMALTPKKQSFRVHVYRTTIVGQGVKLVNSLDFRLLRFRRFQVYSSPRATLKVPFVQQASFTHNNVIVQCGVRTEEYSATLLMSVDARDVLRTSSGTSATQIANNGRKVVNGPAKRLVAAMSSFTN